MTLNERAKKRLLMLVARVILGVLWLDDMLWIEKMEKKIGAHFGEGDS